MKLTKIADVCPDKLTCPAVNVTDHDTIVVQGVRVTDPETLAWLALPSAEAAVEIPRALWPAR